MGFLSNWVFSISFANYLGLPCPLYHKLEGFYVGHKSKLQQVDCFGHSFCALGALLGGHHLKAHQKVVHLLGNIVHFAGLTHVNEFHNMFSGLVPSDVFIAYLADYGANPPTASLSVLFLTWPYPIPPC